MTHPVFPFAATIPPPPHPYAVWHDPQVTGRRAVVISSGLDGLSAAVTLARAGLIVRVHQQATAGADPMAPLGVMSPLLTRLDLARHGLHWHQPPVPVAHPLPGRPAVLLHRSLDQTCTELGRDGPAWRRLHEQLVPHWEHLLGLVSAPPLPGRWPPRRAVGPFGLRAAPPASVLARAMFREDPARALFAGIAAHTLLPLQHPLTAPFGLLLGAAGHAGGWLVAQGGYQAIERALVAELEAHSGRVSTDHRPTDLRHLGPADLVLLDLPPPAIARLAGDRLTPAVRRGLLRWRQGSSRHTVQYLLDGPVPWADPRVAEAASVHLGGTLSQVNAALTTGHRGRHPAYPLVQVHQPRAVDPAGAGCQQVIQVTTVLPPDADTDLRTQVTTQVTAALEQHAPGVVDRVTGRLESQAEGAHWHPLRAPQLAPGLFRCAEASPGAAVPGLGGYHSARAALAWLRRQVERGRPTGARPELTRPGASPVATHRRSR